MYVELHAASAFSFLQGASLPEALVDRAAALGYPALALLDRDGVYGAPRFHKAACAAGIKPLIGAELTIAAFRAGGAGQAGGAGRAGRAGEAGRAGGAGEGGGKNGIDLPHPPYPPRNAWALPVLCETQEGYRNLCRLITRMKMRAPKGEGALTLEDLDGSTRGLVALAGRAVLWAPGAPGAPFNGRNGVGGPLDRLVGLFGRDNVYIELQRHFRRDEEADNQTLVQLAS